MVLIIKISVNFTKRNRRSEQFGRTEYQTIVSKTYADDLPCFSTDESVSDENVTRKARLKYYKKEKVNFSSSWI